MTTAAKRRTTKPNPTPDLAAMQKCLEALRVEASQLILTHPEHGHQLYGAIHEATMALVALGAAS